jgi:rhodanese-related sulfurtransferase
VTVLGRTALQAGAVCLGGLLLGLVGNTLSPAGLSLTRDYFPVEPRHSFPSTVPEDAADSASPGHTPAAPETDETAVSDRIPRIDTSTAQALFEDPRREAELVVFIDARNQTTYDQGHIPGAFLFDHYRPEQHLAEVLPVCQTAELIIVYCNGGSCEDSLLTARTLREMGVAGDRLRLFEAGFEGWTNAGLPVEVGPRLSGNLLPIVP